MAISTTAGDLPKGRAGSQNDWLVIGASSLGTVFEWYDFYLYGLLATVISAQFFSGVNDTTGFIFALAAFAAGFAVRPFGALVFGRLGDLVGRKHTFLITMSIMGLATFAVGILPSYATAGVAAPVMLVLLRLLQGLALGGEYGGAATYVAEFSPPGKRGFFTSYTDHGNDWSLRCTAGGDRHPYLLRRGRLQGVGMAHTVLGLHSVAGGLSMDPNAAGGKSGIRQNEEPGNHLEGTAPGSVWPVGESQSRFDRATRRRHG